MPKNLRTKRPGAAKAARADLKLAISGLTAVSAAMKAMGRGLRQRNLRQASGGGGGQTLYECAQLAWEIAKQAEQVNKENQYLIQCIVRTIIAGGNPTEGCKGQQMFLAAAIRQLNTLMNRFATNCA